MSEGQQRGGCPYKSDFFFAYFAFFAANSPTPNLLLCDLCALCGEFRSSLEPNGRSVKRHVTLQARHFFFVDILADLFAELLDIRIGPVLFELAQHAFTCARNR